MEPGDLRFTAHTVRTGQPRPYADSELVIQLKFEFKGWNENAPIAPYPVPKNTAMKAASSLPIGFTAVERKDTAGWWDSYLKYFRPINTDLDVEKSAEWEFLVVTPFTDWGKAMKKIVQLRPFPQNFTAAEQLLERVKAEIFLSQLTYVALAQRTGVSHSTINNLASGKTRWPRPTTLFPLMQALGLHLKVEKD